MSQFDYKPYYRRNLPHIQPPGATFFVTFHLSGSLPRTVLRQWTREKHQIEKEKRRLVKLPSGVTSAECVTLDKKREDRESEWQRQWFRKFETTPDRAQSGPLWLKDERIAKEVDQSLRYRDGKVYRLDAYCIMANHVHIVFAPLVTQPSVTHSDSLRDNSAEAGDLCYNSLSSIMQSLKGYTAWKANRLLRRQGSFWQHESYDRCIRDASEWERIITYVLNNPVKAGLVENWEEWRWSYRRASDRSANCQFAC